MSEKEYIEREALLEQLEIAFDKEGKKADECAERKMHDAAVKYGHGQYCYLVSKTMVKEAPSADVVEVRHGVWIVTENGCVVHCSDCGTRLELCYPDGTEVRNLPYCPNCGAKMDGKGEGE